MAYTPADGSNIIARFVSAGVYDPADGAGITANFGITPPVYPVGVRALLFGDGMLRQITDTEIGTGRKPLRSLEGKLLVISGTGFRELGTNEVLLL